MRPLLSSLTLGSLFLTLLTPPLRAETLRGSELIPARTWASLAKQQKASAKAEEHAGSAGTKTTRAQPRAELPEDAEPKSADPAVRAAISEARVPSTTVDEELQSLRAAEEALFPEPLRGLTPGWTFQLPSAEGMDDGKLGLPYSATPLLPRKALSSSDAAWIKTLSLPDLPVNMDERVVTYLKFYRDNPRGRGIAAIWARRSGRYRAAIQAELRRAGLPADLVWLSLVESGHNPTISSQAGAAGLWQFMPEAGRGYGLTVDRWVDERRDPVRSTQAAIKFLADLYERFGSWELAMAAYNMGHVGLSRAIAKYNSNDYWTLSRLEGGIPWETTLYVPKIFALAIVMNNPEAFGLARIEPDPPVRFDTILVEPMTDLGKVASLAGIEKAQLLEQNPKFLTELSGPNSGQSLAVPLGQGEKVSAALLGKGKKVRFFTVRYGDDLESLALRLGTSQAALAKENRLAKNERLGPGTVLSIPADAETQRPATEKPVYVVSRLPALNRGEKLWIYRVVQGDELGELASALGLSVSDILRENALDQAAKLRAGMSLVIRLPEGRNLPLVRLEDAADARLLLAGSPEFHEYFEGLRGYRRVEVTVRKGDTLSAIGQRFGMSVGSMERVNRRSRSAALVPGETLIVYTDKLPDEAPGTGAGKAEVLPAVVAPRPDLLPKVSSSAP